MNIRSLRADDLNSLLALYEHLHEIDEPLPDRVVVDCVWNELLSNTSCRCFGGFVDEQLMCSCTLVIIPNLTRGCRPYGLIENVVTHQDFRGQGLGKAVLTYALAHAWSVNCYKVMLLTGRKDEAVFKFYESVGFNRHEKQAFVAKPGVSVASLAVRGKGESEA